MSTSEGVTVVFGVNDEVSDGPLVRFGTRCAILYAACSNLFIL